METSDIRALFKKRQRQVSADNSNSNAKSPKCKRAEVAATHSTSTGVEVPPTIADGHSKWDDNDDVPEEALIGEPEPEVFS